MAQFQKTVEIWSLKPSQRKALQPGQWITAGGALGRWAGQRAHSGIDVAQWFWFGGDRSLKRFRLLREYAKGGI